VIRVLAITSTAAVFITVGLVLLWPASAFAAERCGTASWYGAAHAGRTMANGRPFDPAALTAASWDYPLGTQLTVSRGRLRVVVTVTDRGPAKRLHRIIDLSRGAAARLRLIEAGIAKVCVERLK
jgi:rare lipoprotein A